MRWVSMTYKRILFGDGKGDLISSRRGGTTLFGWLASTDIHGRGGFPLTFYLAKRWKYKKASVV